MFQIILKEVRLAKNCVAFSSKCCVNVPVYVANVYEIVYLSLINIMHDCCHNFLRSLDTSLFSERFNRDRVLSILILKHPGSQITSNIKNNCE